MLTNVILNIFHSFAGYILSLIPDVSLSGDITSAVATASTYLSALSAIAPVITIVAIMGLLLAIEGVVLVIKIINWFVRKIPTIQ
jgi:hypothetical protein